MLLSKNKMFIIAVLVILGFSFLLYHYGQTIIPYFFQPTSTSANAGTYKANNSPEVIVKNLTVPWELVFLPDGDLLVTERSGTLKRIGKINKAISIPDVVQIGEGGLLGMALDPDFTDNQYLYLYMTTRKSGHLVNKTIIFSNIPAARFHNGGRIAFGPDGYLYVATGDALAPALAQDKTSLAGKILRLTRQGESAPGNPFRSPVYSYGHRNPQGLTWDNQGHLWETEHGQSAKDEVNLIESGKNYGWPVIQGNEKAPDMVTPTLTSGKDETWAPGGAIIINNSLFFSGLRSQTLYEATLNRQKNGVQSLTGHYRQQYGRIRNVVPGPDGYLYFMTSNQDGRGWPNKGDDKVLRIHPDALK